MATAANLAAATTHLTDIKGAGWTTTDTLEAIRDRGDAAWITASGFMPSTEDGSSFSAIPDMASQTLLTAVAGYIDTEIAAILLSTGTTIPALIATAQADLDIITGADGVNLLSGTQSSIDAIESAVSDKTGYKLASDGLALVTSWTVGITGDLNGNVTGSVGSVSGNVDGSVASVVGHTAQTGDSFARLGAPVGASISADIAAVQADLPIKIAKNTAISNFPFIMVLSSDDITPGNRAHGNGPAVN